MARWFLRFGQLASNAKLTLNYGLRYELPTVPYSVNGEARILNPAQTALVPATLPAPGLKFNGPNHDNWAPRLGFAYRVTDKTVVRGGGGFYYNPNQIEQLHPGDDESALRPDLNLFCAGTVRHVRMLCCLSRRRRPPHASTAPHPSSMSSPKIRTCRHPGCISGTSARSGNYGKTPGSRCNIWARIPCTWIAASTTISRRPDPVRFNLGVPISSLDKSVPSPTTKSLPMKD